ncbi:uncharacterized protein LOC135372758 [Ornithodoros turicata]|uniref:uncharacterized protein LOC135372758 n=1 Tax=Ornithodoros turicata TaxID=34597 RepID=UPI00313880C8
MPQESTRQLALEVIAALEADKTLIYTDGSVTKTGATSTVYIPETQGIIKSNLTHKTSSTAAELHGISSALHYIKEQPPRDWAILTDSKPALYTITSSKTTPNDALTEDILETYTELLKKGHTVQLQWVLSHYNINGNEKADEAAREAHAATEKSAIPLSRQDSRTIARNACEAEMKKLLTNSNWRNPRLQRLDGAHTYTGTKHLRRREAAQVHRLRLGMAFTKAYKVKINLARDPLCTACKVPEDDNHVLLHCPQFDSQRAKLRQALQRMDTRPFTLEKILGAWPTHDQCHRAVKHLTTFLHEAKLSAL